MTGNLQAIGGVWLYRRWTDSGPPGGWGSPGSVDTDQEFTGVSVRAAMHACS